MSNIKIAILVPNPNVQHLETFIKNHVEKINFDKIVLYGGPIPFKLSENDKLSLLLKLTYKFNVFFKTKKSKEKWFYQKLVLKSHLKKHHVQLVFAEYVLTGSNVLDVCKELNIPIIATGLGYEISVTKIINDNRKNYQEFLKYCSSVIVVAKSMTKILTELGCDKNKIIHSPAGASTDFLNIEPDYNSMQLFAIGRFVEKKSPHSTILSFYKVLQVYPNAKLIIAGDGPLLPMCMDIVRSLKIENSVSFVGKISQEQQRDYLKNSRIFVQHSKLASDGDSEGTPVAIVEASSAGLPVVSTIHAGIIDVVVNNETGFLVDEGDVDTMAEKIILLLSDSELAKKMGAAGKHNIQTNFTLNQHIQKIEEHISNQYKVIKAIKD
ncbi:MAG: glycosyltransferase [Bacteroidetes bacterium]|nr:glycosyltransferase [Bacteroidota bacterium]